MPFRLDIDSRRSAILAVFAVLLGWVGYGSALSCGALQNAQKLTSKMTSLTTKAALLMTQFSRADGPLYPLASPTCPDFCPTTLSDIADVLNLIDGPTTNINALFISIDPEQDTPEILASYVPYFHSSILGVTGSVEAIGEIASQFGVIFSKVGDQNEASTYAMSHSTQIFIVNPEREIVKQFHYGTPPADIFAYLKKQSSG